MSERSKIRNLTCLVQILSVAIFGIIQEEGTTNLKAQLLLIRILFTRQKRLLLLQRVMGIRISDDIVKIAIGVTSVQNTRRQKIERNNLKIPATSV